MDTTNKQRIIPDLSVVILCYKAGESIRNFIDKTKILFHKAGIFDFELILVGNYNKDSDDPTPKIIAKIASGDPRIRYVAKPKKGMMGWDMRRGLEITKGNFIAIIDGDGQMPIKDLIRVYRVIKIDRLDLVKTYRIERGDGWQRKILSLIYNLLFSMLFPQTRSLDINSKPKIITREAYNKLKLESDDWFIDAEIIIQAQRHNFRIGEIPTTFYGLRGSRQSFVGPRAVFEFIKNLIIYKYKDLKAKKT